MIDGKNLDDVVVAFSGCDPKATHAVGHMVAYADFPTAVLHTANGDQINWGAHLCRPATHGEAVAYWRSCAEAAEAHSRRSDGAHDPGSKLVADLYKVAMFGDRGNHAQVAQRIREVLRAHGVTACQCSRGCRVVKDCDGSCAAGGKACHPMDSYIVAQQGPQPGIGALTPDGAGVGQSLACEHGVPHGRTCEACDYAIGVLGTLKENDRG